MHAKAHDRDSPGDAALRSQAGPARTKHAGRLEASWSGPSGLEQRVFGGSPSFRRGFRVPIILSNPQCWQQAADRRRR